MTMQDFHTRFCPGIISCASLTVTQLLRAIQAASGSDPVFPEQFCKVIRHSPEIRLYGNMYAPPKSFHQFRQNKRIKLFTCQQRLSAMKGHGNVLSRRCNTADKINRFFRRIPAHEFSRFLSKAVAAACLTGHCRQQHKTGRMKGTFHSLK